MLSKLIRWAMPALLSFVLAVSALAAPAPPSALWIQAQNGGAYLKWNGVPGATNYSIYRGTTPGGESGTAIGTTTGLAYTDGSVSNATTYYYYVKAHFDANLSGASPEASVTPGTPVLSQVQIVAQPGAAQITINWSKNVGATFYMLMRYDPTYGWRVIRRISGGSTTTATDASVVNGREYDYKVLPGNTDGIGSESDEFFAAAGDTPISAPGGIWAVPQNGYIHVAWNRIPAAIGYVIYRSDTPGTEGLSPYKVVYNLNNYFDHTVPNGTTQYYKVAVIDPSGVGFQSGEAFATAGATKLPAPLMAANTASGYVRVDWSPVQGATGYTVFRSVGNNQNYALYTKTTGATYKYTDTAVTAGTRYYYAVCGTNSGGTGNAGEVNAKAGSQLPPAPTGIAAQAHSNYIRLYWNPVPSVYYYNVYRSTISGQETLYAANVGSTVYDDSGVDSVTTYYYKVRPTLASGEGYSTTEVSAQAGSSLLAAPLIAAGVSAGKAYVDINLIAGADYYNVYRTTDFNGNNGYVQIRTKLVPAVGANSIHYVDTTGLPDVMYTYVVCAVRTSSEGSASNKVSATPGNVPIEAPTGTIAFAGANSVSVQCDPQPSATSYNVYRSLTPTMPAYPYAVNSSNSFYDSGVTAGTLYYYAFAAVDQDGQSLLSPVCSAKPGIAAVTAPLLTLNQTATTNVLNWSTIGAAKYDVYRADNNSTSTYRMIAQDVAGTTYTDSDVVVGLQYSYKVYPVTVNGAGSVSNRVVGIPGSTPILAPTGVSAYAYATSVSIRFNKVDGATNYNLYRSTSTGTQGAVPVIVSGGYGMTDTGLTPGTRYYYKVTATDDHGQSLKSEEVTAKPGSAPLGGPSLSIGVVGASLKLTWTSNAGATGYNIYKAIYNGSYVLIKHIPAGTLTYSDTSVTAGATYYYRVTAFNADGEGNNSNTVNGHT